MRQWKWRPASLALRLQKILAKYNSFKSIQNKKVRAQLLGIDLQIRNQKAEVSEAELKNKLYKKRKLKYANNVTPMSIIKEQEETKHIIKGYLGLLLNLQICLTLTHHYGNKIWNLAEYLLFSLPSHSRCLFSLSLTTAGPWYHWYL